MNLREEMREYIDLDGFVCNRKVLPGERGASGNGLLYSSLYLIVLSKTRRKPPHLQKRKVVHD